MKNLKLVVPKEENYMRRYRNLVSALRSICATRIYEQEDHDPEIGYASYNHQELQEEFENPFLLNHISLQEKQVYDTQRIVDIHQLDY